MFNSPHTLASFPSGMVSTQYILLELHFFMYKETSHTKKESSCMCACITLHGLWSDSGKTPMKDAMVSLHPCDECSNITETRVFGRVVHMELMR